MIQNIKLTEKDDILIAFQVAPWNGDHTSRSRLSGSIGVHQTCTGFIDIHEFTTYKALVCRACGLRVEIPNNIKTYGELRGWAETLK